MYGGHPSMLGRYQPRVSRAVGAWGLGHSPGAGNHRLKPLVSGVQHAQAQTVGAEVFACPVRDVDKLGVDVVGEIQGQHRREGDRVRRLGVLKDGLGVDLVADEMELVLSAEAGDLPQCVGRLCTVSSSSRPLRCREHLRSISQGDCVG